MGGKELAVDEIDIIEASWVQITSLGRYGEKMADSVDG